MLILHKCKEIEPSIILAETNYKSAEVNTIIEHATEKKSMEEIRGSLAKPKTHFIVPKPKKGKWIVQLKRIDDT